jgi:hypothetical protein
LVFQIPAVGIRPVPIAAVSAAKITRNRTLRTPFLRLIRDYGWKHSKEESAEFDLDVYWNVVLF